MMMEEEKKTEQKIYKKGKKWRKWKKGEEVDDDTEDGRNEAHNKVWHEIKRGGDYYHKIIIVTRHIVTHREKCVRMSVCFGFGPKFLSLSPRCQTECMYHVPLNQKQLNALHVNVTRRNATLNQMLNIKHFSLH